MKNPLIRNLKKKIVSNAVGPLGKETHVWDTGRLIIQTIDAPTRCPLLRQLGGGQQIQVVYNTLLPAGTSYRIKIIHLEK
jgi:hypothetical protein